MHRAVTARDPRAYSSAIDSLTEAFHREADRREACKLLDRLSEDHPELARRFAESPTEAVWETRLVNLDGAWAWRQARTFQDTMLKPGREAKLEGELEAVETQLRKTVTQLAADRALYHCLDRMTAGQKQALSAYASATANAGRGMTALGKRHLKAARSAMRDARAAVPAWVMPIKQVAEMIDPEPDAFDVVIVDEASQVGLDGLMLLWLAPRIIVVGDDKQCVPFYTGGKHERLNELLDSLLPHLTDWQRDGLSPKSNLYDLLSARFSETIRLTEHFRCMPEIIKWSSAQFYPDNELVPLRQYGADRLRPLEVVHVHEGHCEGRRETLVNRPEAERIVAKLQELAEDEAYAKRSFGVIVLRSGHQTRLLENLIDMRIDSSIQERHNIRVGTAEQFQGDERDVILLSLVVDADNTRALTGQGDGRRFNVAASRARDQMWLFTSVTPDQLRSRDLRHSLLTYMQAPPELQAHLPAFPPFPPTSSASRSSRSSSSGSSAGSRNAATTSFPSGKSAANASTSSLLERLPVSPWSATAARITPPLTRSVTTTSGSGNCAGLAGSSGAYAAVSSSCLRRIRWLRCGSALTLWGSGPESPRMPRATRGALGSQSRWTMPTSPPMNSTRCSMRMRPSLSKGPDVNEIFDDSTLTEIAHLICGDETPLLYRKGYEIAAFFQRAGWDDVPEYDGTPRHKWTLDLLRERQEDGTDDAKRAVLRLANRLSTTTSSRSTTPR